MEQTLPIGVRILLDSFFGVTAVWYRAIPASFYLAGLWLLLEKSGVKGWWALIPCAREYKLAQCAGRESEGRSASAAEFAQLILNALSYISLNGDLYGDLTYVFLSVGAVTMEIVVFVLRLKIFAGLTEVYGARRRWLWLWAFSFFRFIPAVLWGCRAKYQPEWKVEDLRRELLQRVSGGRAEVMETGLTVNLKEKSVWDFFRKKILLWDIHLYIPQGRMVLLLGGSGSGKTTLVNAVNGYEKARAEVVLNGTDVYRHFKKMQYETGFVPQQDLMRQKDTVYNTLMDSAKLRLPRDCPPEVRRERVAEVMEVFGLTPVKGNLVQKLSGGQRKRLSIALELIANPSLFILDEPDSGLDGVMARELMQQLRRIADTGKIVIVITHTPDRVIDLFDDVIVLAKDSAHTGRLAFFGSVPEARTFFGCEDMEQIVMLVNRCEEGGAGRADEFVAKYAEVQHA